MIFGSGDSSSEFYTVLSSPADRVGSTLRYSSPQAARHAVIATASNNNLFI